MSYVLRHNPERFGLKLDLEGWIDTDSLIRGLKREYPDLEKQHLIEIVDTNTKKRFSFNEDQSRIKANQGHSIEVDLQLMAIEPPKVLYHGTVERFMDAIKTKGLKKMSRQHVHLSSEIETAQNVGSRRGKPIVLKINALQMQQNGYLFYRSINGVWLTDHVPTDYLSI